MPRWTHGPLAVTPIRSPGCTSRYSALQRGRSTFSPAMPFQERHHPWFVFVDDGAVRIVFLVTRPVVMNGLRLIAVSDWE